MTEKTRPTDIVQVTYYTDPLCCWSWATEPQWRRFRYQFRHVLHVRNCMGGLIPSWKNFTDSVNDVNRPSQMGPLWLEAAQISGMPIHNRLWLDSPPASSYLSCIAVKCAGLQSATAEEIYLRKLREALMLNGENIALQSVLFKVAEKIGNLLPAIFNYEKFTSDMQNGNGLELFRTDLQETQNYRITRFPTMIFRKAGTPPLLLAGHREYSSYLDAMRRMLVNFNENEAIDSTEYTAYWGNMTDREMMEITPNEDLTIKETAMLVKA